MSEVTEPKVSAERLESLRLAIKRYVDDPEGMQRRCADFTPDVYEGLHNVIRDYQRLRELERDARSRMFSAYTAGWRKGHDTPKPTDCSDYSEWRYAMSEGEANHFLDDREAIEAKLAALKDPP
jgi:hypothetical protein